jgi:hypothetical protein
MDARRLRSRFEPSTDRRGMTDTFSCSRDDEGAARYVAGRLSADEVREFEEHLLECAHCVARVRESATLRSALRGRRRWRAWWAVPAAAAAAVVFLMGRNPHAHLAGVSPPRLEGATLRADAADPARDFTDQGMTAYGAGRYREAAALLATADSLQPSAGVTFYRGISLLLDNRQREAARVLGPLANAVTPWSDEARIYRAKAMLRLRQPDSALAVLAGGSGDWARALADSITQP